jgi:hypothetical protein
VAAEGPVERAPKPSGDNPGRSHRSADLPASSILEPVLGVMPSGYGGQMRFTVAARPMAGCTRVVPVVPRLHRLPGRWHAAARNPGRRAP